jgi:hypothetical protein
MCQICARSALGTGWDRTRVGVGVNHVMVCVKSEIPSRSCRALEVVQRAAVTCRPHRHHHHHHHHHRHRAATRALAASWPPAPPPCLP